MTVVNYMDPASDVRVESLNRDIFGATSDVVGVTVRVNRSLDKLNVIDDTMNDIINRTNVVSH